MLETGVYKLKCIANGRFYYGYSINVPRRIAGSEDEQDLAA